MPVFFANVDVDIAEKAGVFEPPDVSLQPGTIKFIAFLRVEKRLNYIGPGALPDDLDLSHWCSYGRGQSRTPDNSEQSKR